MSFQPFNFHIQNYTLQKYKPWKSTWLWKRRVKICCTLKLVRKRDEFYSIDETTCCQAEKIWEQMKKGGDSEFQVWRVFLASLSTGRNHPCVEYCPTIRSFPRRNPFKGRRFLVQTRKHRKFRTSKEIQPLLRMFKLLWHNGTEITFLLWE